MIKIGIDPGLTGGVAVMLNGSLTPEVYDLGSKIDGKQQLDEEKFLALLDAVTALSLPIECAVERQTSAPGQGVVSTFQTGMGFGWLLGALKAKYITPEVLPAKRWMKSLGIPGGLDRKVRKKRIAEKVQSRFPDAVLHGKRGGLLDGRSDACGILIHLLDR